MYDAAVMSVRMLAFQLATSLDELGRLAAAGDTEAAERLLAVAGVLEK